MPSLIGRPLHPKKKHRPLKPSLEPLPSTSNGTVTFSSQQQQRDGESSFARALASGDASTRLRALDALVAWLVARGGGSGGKGIGSSSHKKQGDGASPPGVSKADMIKIWKGLFYAFWHSDLAPVQVRFGIKFFSLFLTATT